LTHPLPTSIDPPSLHDPLPILRCSKTARRCEGSVAACAIELWVAVLSLIEKVEDLGPELPSEFLGELPILYHRAVPRVEAIASEDRKSTRLNSSHRTISYAVFC